MLKPSHNSPLAPIEIITNSELETEGFKRRVFTFVIIASAILGAFLGVIMSHFTKLWLR